MYKIHFIIPTYHRYELLRICINSIYKYCPLELLGNIIVVDANEQREPLQRCLVLPIEKGYCGLAYNKGAEYLYNKNIHLDDGICFLDDDMELQESFKNIDKVLDKVNEKNVGMIHFMTRPGIHNWTKIRIGYKQGGIFARAGTFRNIMFGRDYLDDVEVFMRSDIKGYDNYRCGFIVSTHKFQSDGGVRDLLNMRSTATAPMKFSKLHLSYPGVMERGENSLIDVRLAPKYKINEMRKKYGQKMEAYFSDVVGY